MLIIKNTKDVADLVSSGKVTIELATHLQCKIETSLKDRGLLAILEVHDTNLVALGISESLHLIMPEYVTHLKCRETSYYILYIMASNHHVYQLYLPDSIMDNLLRRWLMAQPSEEGAGSND